MLLPFFKGYETYTVIITRLKFLVDGWQQMHLSMMEGSLVSMMEGSLVYEDRI